MAENTNAHTEVPGGHGGGFPPFNSDTFPSQLVWFAVSFALLYALMSRLVLPRVTSIFEQRRARIAADVAEAGRLKTEADSAIAAHQKALADARAGAQAMAAETRAKLAAEADQRRKGLEERLHARLAEAEKAIAATKAAAMANVRSIAVETGGAIVQRLIGVAPAEKAVAEAVDDVLKR
jgi:F-type H+-transporting ATPase subunit b